MAIHDHDSCGKGKPRLRITAEQERRTRRGLHQQGTGASLDLRCWSCGGSARQRSLSIFDHSAAARIGPPGG